MDNNGNNGFNYKYSAKEQEELKRIREKYLADTECSELSAMDKIRKLDSGVNQKGMTVSLIVGIFGALVMGFGMSLVMTDLKRILGEYSDMAFVIGMIIGVVGMVGVIAAYPLYHRIIASERKKIAPEILRMTDELIKENK